MKEIMPIDFTSEITMTSKEVCDLINRFRKEERNDTEIKPKSLMAKIDVEVEKLTNAGIKVGGQNILPAEYIDKQGKSRPCYLLSKRWILKMCMSESAVVRDKIQDYIEALENRLQTIQQQQIIDHKDKQIKRLEALIGLRTQHKFEYGKLIKRHLGIKKTDKDYEAIKLMFFYELGVDKWEDITYDRQNVILLNSICETYKPSEQLTLF